MALANAQTLAGTAAASTAGGLAAWEIGIGPAVLFMALAGTALGLLFSPPGGSRARLFVLALVYTMVSAATAGLLAELLSLDHRLDAAIALLLAFFANSAIPALRTAINDRVHTAIGGRDKRHIEDGD
ncbi:MAG: hypothetical protein K6T33_08065 [Thermomonas hydrothermalis]|uniref:hypothetical protein n=1 Tax=Thermomonas hydrothermalis TaxID=213588 RepID=UPI0023533B23|nr:hypothetical protein [Thermomonas hydrothermalis]MCL6619730.1 hypothetical protein [Thermomonas hydrothermalis]